MQRDDLLVWIDLEMTGLNPLTDQIVEIASVITDSNLAVLAEGPDLVVHFKDKEVLDGLVEDKNFPLDRVFAEEIKASTINLKEAERETLRFLETHTTQGSAPLCGNTISMDRFFLTLQMPQITGHLHYRNIDVSSIKELARRWSPDIFKKASEKKKLRHRAKEDILESIEELKYYRDHFLR